MQGTILIRPLEAKLFRDVELFKKMDPYCLVTVGNSSIKGTICKNGGKHPRWDDIIIFPTTNEAVCVLELMDKDTVTADDMIGVCEIDMQEVEDEGRSVKWYELHYKRKLAGEILIEAVYTKDQCPREAMVYNGKTRTKAKAVEGHSGQKAAAKHIIGYKEKKPRQRKDKWDTTINDSENEYWVLGDVLILDGISELDSHAG